MPTPASPAPARRGRPPADAARDLRADLLATARALLDEGGAAALSLREVARRTGCTHQAPYHHFADREALLAALVTEGFQELADRLSAVNDRHAEAGPRETLVASAAAYVGFALSRPGVFRIMFRPDMCDPSGFPELNAESLRAYQELQRLTEIACGADAAREASTVLWAHVHGLSCLLLDGPLGLQLPEDKARRAHLTAVSAAFADQFLAARTPPAR